MSTARQRRRGTTAQHSTFTGLAGEMTVDTDKHTVVVHDGSTAGGFPLAKASDIPSLTSYAPLADPTFTGNPKAPTPTPGDNDTSIATTGFVTDAVSTAITAIKGGVSASFDTLIELYNGLKGLGALTLAAGDILYASAADTLARLAKGTDGQVLTLSGGVPTWASSAAAVGTARNRVVNPAMQISSINGNTAGTTTGYSPADNWYKDHVSSAGTLTVQRVQSVTPKGAKDRIRVTIIAADASLAAGEYLKIRQDLVGQEIADFQYGSASAKQVLLRFLFKGPAGTYAVALQNAAQNRSYVALFTISAGNANTDTIQTFTITGDTTGTWTTTSTTGLTLNIVLACGSTFQGATGWQAGNILGTSGVSNGMATLNDVFEVGEVGLYLDVAAAGTFPTWELPSYTVGYDYLAYTPWVAYTPTFTGFGTPTGVVARSRRIGDTLELDVKFKSGTPTATEARMSLGFNGVDGGLTSDSAKVPSIMLAGTGAFDSNATALMWTTLIESGVSYVTFGVQISGGAGLTKQNGNALLTSGTGVSFNARVPISGW